MYSSLTVDDRNVLYRLAQDEALTVEEVTLICRLRYGMTLKDAIRKRHEYKNTGIGIVFNKKVLRNECILNKVKSASVLVYTILLKHNQDLISVASDFKNKSGNRIYYDEE